MANISSYEMQLASEIKVENSDEEDSDTTYVETDTTGTDNGRSLRLSIKVEVESFEEELHTDEPDKSTDNNSAIPRKRQQNSKATSSTDGILQGCSRTDSSKASNVVVKMENVDYESDPEIQMVIDEEALEFSKFNTFTNVGKLESNQPKDAPMDYDEALTAYRLAPNPRCYERVLKQVSMSENTAVNDSTGKCKNISIYKCAPCFRVWNDMKSFAEHISSAHIENTLSIKTECINNVYQLVAQGSASNLEQCRPVRRNQCHKCKIVFRYACSLTKHLVQKQYECKSCSATFSKCMELHKHAMKCLSRPVTQQSTAYPKFCGCGLQFDDRNAFQMHKRNCQEKRTFVVYKCSICGMFFTKEQDLDSHLVSLHSVRSDEEVKVQLKVCKLCQKIYVGQRALHMCPRRRLRYRCEYCSAGFQTIQFLRVHMKASEGSGHCGVCMTTFVRQCMKWRHECDIQLLLMYVCRICKDSFLERQHVEDHLEKIHKKADGEMDKLITQVTLSATEEDVAAKSIEVVTEITSAEGQPSDLVEPSKVEQEQPTVKPELPVIVPETANDVAVISISGPKTLKVEPIVVPETVNVDLMRQKLSNKLLAFRSKIDKVFQPTISRKNNVSNTTMPVDEYLSKDIIIKQEIKIEPKDEDTLEMSEEYEDDIIMLSATDGDFMLHDDAPALLPERTEQSVEEFIKNNAEITFEEKDKMKKKKNPKKVTCQSCGRTFGFRNYKNHLKICSTRSTFSFKKGKKKVPELQSQNFFCDQCGSICEDLQDYVNHWTLHGLNLFECPLCRQQFMKSYGFAAHIKRHILNNYAKAFYLTTDGKPLPADKNVNLCKMCKQEVCKTEQLRHWEKHVFEELSVKKEVAEQEPTPTIQPAEEAVGPTDLLSEKTLAELIQRLLSHIPPVPSNKPDVFSHRKTNSEQRNRSCNLCPKKFSRSPDLKRHLIEHLVRNSYRKKIAEQNFVCEICTDNFPNVHSYKKHLRAHADLPLYQCNICDKSFADSSNFAKHKKVHGFTCMECDICSRRFATKRMIEEHMKYHEDHAPIKCKQCDKVFHFYSSLRKHIRAMHERVSYRMKCKYCEKKLKSNKEKWDHLWVVHRQRTFKGDCPYCDASYRTFREIKNHLRDSHDVEIIKQTLESYASMYEYLKSQPAGNVDKSKASKTLRPKEGKRRVAKKNV